MQQYLFKFFSLVILLAFSSSSFALELKVPSNLIAFDSAAGIALFNQANDKQDYWKLSKYFSTERNQSFCSLASLAMVLNASGIPKPIEKPYSPYGFFTQMNVFNPAVSKLISVKEVDKAGLTLNQLAKVAKTFPVKVTAVHAQTNGLALFRERAEKAIASGNEFIIVNLFRSKLDEVGGGHFSPLAAYDTKTDRFLLMDVARYKYPPVWVKAKTLWEAMDTVDSTSKKTRGYIILGK